MNLHPLIERGLYALIILLSVVALFLVLSAPSDILNSHVVYQGF